MHILPYKDKDMTTEQRNKAWACLPKEVREKAKSAFNYTPTLVQADSHRGVADTLEYLFGSHNLTSDSEPTELLFVERKKVQEIYQEGLTKHDYFTKIGVLYELFGDKCLPDNPDYSNPANIGIEEQAKHQFKPGDKVRISENPSFPHNSPL